MRKNYSLFNKVAGFVLAMAMMVGFTSCEDILGEWDRPAVKQAIETIVNVTGADPAEVTAALQAIVTDEAIAAAAAKGEPIKVTVTGSGVSTDATDKTITIPQKNGAEIEISFAAAPTGTDTNPLEFTASSGASGASSTSQNDLTIDMPTANGLVITIELPQTTVTLTTNGTSTVYKTVTAKTATNTLNVESGVTIEKLIVEGGNVVINGGKIENVKIADNQEVTFTYDEISMESIEIGSGATVKFANSANEDIFPKIESVKGDAETTAKFYIPGFKNPPREPDQPEEDYQEYGYAIKGIKSISNVNVLIPEETGANYENVIFKDCNVNAGGFYTLQNSEWPEGDEVSISGCKFNGGGFYMIAPNLSDSHSNTTLEFKDCIFVNWDLQCFVYAPDDQVTDNATLKMTVKFNNCKLGETNFTDLTLDQLKGFISRGIPYGQQFGGDPNHYYIQILFVIGEKTYKFTGNDAWDPNLELVEVAE